MGVKIHEPGRDDHAACVDLLSATSESWANLGDLSRAHRNVRFDAGPARAIEDRSATNDQVMRALLPDECRRTRQHEQRSRPGGDEFPAIDCHFSRPVARRAMRIAARLACTASMLRSAVSFTV